MTALVPSSLLPLNLVLRCGSPRRCKGNDSTSNKTKRLWRSTSSSTDHDHDNDNDNDKRRGDIVVAAATVASSSGPGSEPPTRSSSVETAPGAPNEPHTAYTRTSAHARVPHTVSVTVTRPAAKHLAFAPQRLPAPHHAYTELEAGNRELVILVYVVYGIMG